MEATENTFSLEHAIQCRVWPKPVKDFLEYNRSFFEKYFEEERRADRRRESLDYGVSIQARLSLNSSLNEYKKLLGCFDRLCSNYSLRAYHCTRLTDAEIEDIKLNGLRPLDSEHQQSRVRSLGLSQKITSRLIKVNRCEENNRAGQICFALCKPSADPGGFVRFFKNWGGEALYIKHEECCDIGPILRSTGHPCVATFDIKIGSICPHWEICRLIIQTYFGYTQPKAMYEGSTRTPIGKKHGLSLHIYPSPQFHELAKWPGD